MTSASWSSSDLDTNIYNGLVAGSNIKCEASYDMRGRNRDPGHSMLGSSGAATRGGGGRSGGTERGRGRRDSVPAVGAREAQGKRGPVADSRSRDQVLSPRRAARHVSAVPVPDCAELEPGLDGVRIRGRQSSD